MKELIGTTQANFHIAAALIGWRVSSSHWLTNHKGYFQHRFENVSKLIEYHEDYEDHIPILQQEEQVTVKLFNTLPWLYQYSSITGGLLQVWRMVSNRLFELYSNSVRFSN